MSQMKLDQPSYDTMQQAVEWFVLLNDQEVSEKDKANWNQWLQEPQHAKAWKLVENVHQRFNLAESEIGREGVSQSLKAARKDRISRRRLLQTGTALGLFGWLSFQYTPVGKLSQRFTADYASRTGEIKNVNLQDGGKLWLNTASAVNVDYSFEKRLVKVLSGEILVQTNKDPLKRPFQVVTERGLLTALGTQFTVRDQDDSTFIAVYEGAVEIRTKQGQSTILNAGQQTSFTESEIKPLVPAESNRKAWSEGVIVANDMTLKNFAAELSRYRHGYLSVDPDVADLTIMGTFPVDQTDHALGMLTDSLPVTVQAPVPWWVQITKK